MGIFDRLVSKARRRSPWLFHLNTGGCNGCDIELVACLTPRYDVEQLGIRLECSPRHADVLCVSGPVTRNTRAALEAIYAQMPDPKVVVALGSCPASCNVFAGSPAMAGPLDQVVPVDVYVPGCPPRPDAILEGIARAVEILARGGQGDGEILRQGDGETGRRGEVRTQDPGLGTEYSEPRTQNPEPDQHSGLRTQHSEVDPRLLSGERQR